GRHYESLGHNPRTWLSFRDPYKFTYDGKHYLLFCGRSSHGPISRRGCVGLAELEGDEWVLKKPLLFPFAYDDIECPCIVQVNERFYLIGSIREDIKVRYGYFDDLLGPYMSFYSLVLILQFYYAAMILMDECT